MMVMKSSIKCNIFLFLLIGQKSFMNLSTWEIALDIYYHFLTVITWHPPPNYSNAVFAIHENHRFVATIWILIFAPQLHYSCSLENGPFLFTITHPHKKIPTSVLSLQYSLEVFEGAGLFGFRDGLHVVLQHLVDIWLRVETITAPRGVYGRLWAEGGKGAQDMVLLQCSLINHV